MANRVKGLYEKANFAKYQSGTDVGKGLSWQPVCKESHMRCQRYELHCKKTVI